MLGARGRPRILTVSELTATLQGVLDEVVGQLWVAGELSGVRRSAKRHLYFSLKDEASQLGAVMFARAVQTLPFELADGLDVVVRGRLDLFRGSLQLVVEDVEPRGLGALRLAFEQLKARLDAEGLFDARRKRPLPTVPRVVGIVTALSGAAVHDMLTTLRRRWPAARAVVRAVRVQGVGAAADIAAGIADLNRLGGVDVVLVGRGGGSFEDLWAFNEEAVARAIARSAVPVVAGVGHEIDVTIADLVADHRAATPTAAATAAVPERAHLLGAVATLGDALAAALERRLRRAREHLRDLGRRLPDPRRRLERQSLRLHELHGRLESATLRRLAWERRDLGTLARRLHAAGPAAAIERQRERIAAWGSRLERGWSARLRDARVAVERAERGLTALSPLACLERGYAIVRQGGADGPIVRDAAAVRPGEAVTLVLARGRAVGRIERTEPAAEPTEAT